MYLFFCGCGDFSHCFKQTGRTVLDFALVPFSSFYIECHHLIVNLQSTPLGYLVATALCASGHWRKFVSQNQTQNGDCKGISSHPSNNSSEKSWSICMSIFCSQVSRHIQVAKAQNLQHKLVLSHFLPFSLRCCPLTRIVQAVFSSSWRVLLKK